MEDHPGEPLLGPSGPQVSARQGDGRTHVQDGEPGSEGHGIHPCTGDHVLQIIAIDGPAASGKSTVGYAVAQRLGFLYFDTGVMYRAVTWAALDRGVDPRDEAAVGRLAETIRIDIQAPDALHADGRQVTVRVEGKDVTWAIRTPEVDKHVSLVVDHPRVRAAMTRRQWEIGHRYGCGQGDKAGVVMVGRDIGTVVLPDAPLKIYLDAPVEERARRRYLELVGRGKEVSYEQVLADMRRRDAIDSHRAVAPLRAAPDAVVVDTGGLTPEEVVERVVALAHERGIGRNSPA